MIKTLKWALAILGILVCLTSCGGDKKAAITTIAEAEHAKIGVMTGSTGEVFAKQRFPEAQLKSFDDIMDAVAAMKAGQLDGLITATSSAIQIGKKNPDLGMLPDILTHEDTAIGFRKGDDQLLDSINQIIASLKKDGTFDDMKQRWFKPDLSPYEELNIEIPSEGEPLRVGVSATREPFNFIDKDGRVTGHDGELARIFASRMRRPLEFMNMKFSALIPALQSGKVDLIVTGMSATEERKKFINFSEPYFANSQVLMVKRSGDAPSGNPLQGDEISSLARVDGKNIAVLSGSAGDLAARKHFSKASFQPMAASADAAIAVKTRKVDAFVYDKSVLLNIAAKDPELVILEEPVDKLEVAAAIRKDNTSLLADINVVLAELKSGGALEQLRKKWVDSNYTVPPQKASRKQTSTKGVLRMGTAATIEPFSFQANGTLTGLDIELAEMIGERLGKSVEFVDMNFEALIPALQSNKIDFALSNFNVTEERKKLVLFSSAYISNDISALVRKSPGAVASKDPTGGVFEDRVKMAAPADLKDKRIGVLLGSVFDAWASKTYPQATILQYRTPADVTLAVKTGKVDASIFPEEQLRDIMRQNPEIGLLGEPVFSLNTGSGFNKESTALLQQFNAFLADIKKNGVYADMVTRWIEQRQTNMPALEQPKTSGAIVVGVSANGAPFDFVQDNQLVGFDIELVKRFGASIGKEVRLSDMEFGGLIAAGAAKKVDLIVASMAITEERKKQINFSDPYFEMHQRVFALKSNIAAYGDQAMAASAKPSFLDSVVNSFRSNILEENRYLLLLDGLKTTVILSILSTVFGTLLGSVICFLRMSSSPWLNGPARLYITLLRGMPVLVLLMLIYYVVFASVDISPVLVAVIAFGMNFGAYASEIFRTGIEGIDKGQTEAGIAMGLTPVQSFLYIVLPQTVQRILPVYKGEFISLVKMTSIVGYIAVQDLTKASDIIRSRTFDAFFPLIMVSVLYFTISWVLMQSLQYVERRTEPKYKRKQRGAA